MPRARKHRVEFANLHVTAGRLKLADLLDSVILPAIYSGRRRKYGSARYFFLEPALVKLPDNEHGVAFEVVKDTLLRREQLYKDGALVADEDQMESAPSGIVLLILENHRVVYVPKTRYAPSLRELENTFDILFKQTRLTLIQQELAKRQAKYGVRKQLEKVLPQIETKLIALTSEESVADAMRRLSFIKSVRIELVKTNAELDQDGTYRDLQKAAIAAHAKRASVEYANAKDGLKATKARSEVVKATKQGVAVVAVKGEDEDGDEVTKTNDDMRVRPEATFEVTTPVGTARSMAKSLKEMVTKGVLAAAQVARDEIAGRIDEVFEKWRASPPALPATPPPEPVDEDATQPGRRRAKKSRR